MKARNKKYGLILSKKSTINNAIIKKPSAFADDSGDEDEQKRKVNVSIQQESLRKHQRKQLQLELDKARAEDPTVFEYDSIYEKIEEKKATRNPVLAEVDRKPKYIQSLINSAKARQHEYERMMERKIQKEREDEGDEFTDKEAFVTSGYKKKMIELAKEEERIKQQDQIDEMNDVKKQRDLSGFYRFLLNNTLAKEDQTSSSNSANVNVDADVAEESHDHSLQDSHDHHHSSRPSQSDRYEHYKKDEDLHERAKEKDKDFSRDREYSHRHEDVNVTSDDGKDSGSYRKRERDSEHVDRPEQLEASKGTQDSNAPTGDIKEVPMDTAKYNRHTSGEAVSEARQRYLARKRAKEAVHAAFKSDA